MKRIRTPEGRTTQSVSWLIKLLSVALAFAVVQFVNSLTLDNDLVTWVCVLVIIGIAVLILINGRKI